MKNLFTNYMPQVITVAGSLFGTLMGTVLGWFLRYANENYGQIYIDVVDFAEKHRGSQEHEFCFKLHINNRSYRTKVLRELSVQFYKKKKPLNECRCRNVTIERFYHPVHTEPECGLICLAGNKFEELDVTGVAECVNLHEATRYEVTYKDIKGKRRKIGSYPCDLAAANLCGADAVLANV
ncbi:MAG: hypothetical protein FWC27_04465 [Firmicutes bacterium]|nr:hypothetical protein [Bacillota bacterium]